MKYHYPIHGLSWTNGIGAPAGIYWLGGEAVIAAHGSSAEDHLLGLGAILVATLRFDGAALECTHAHRPIERVRPAQLMVFT
ncbi:MAG: hypothetical protein ACRENP_28275 [Longimicrobiales bacterium]